MFKHPALLLLFLIYTFCSVVYMEMAKFESIDGSLDHFCVFRYPYVMESLADASLLCSAACRDWRVDCCLGSASDTRFAAYIQS